MIVTTRRVGIEGGFYEPYHVSASIEEITSCLPGPASTSRLERSNPRYARDAMSAVVPLPAQRPETEACCLFVVRVVQVVVPR